VPSVPPFTDLQVARIRHFLGYTVGYADWWTALHGGLENIAQNSPADFAVITNALTASPPGLLAQLEDIEVRMTGALSRIKASAVGSITLNAGELQMLAQQGRRLAAALSQTVGVAIERDVFASGGSNLNASRFHPSTGGSGTWIGK